MPTQLERLYRYRPFGFSVQKCATCNAEIDLSKREAQEKTVFEGKLYFPSRTQFNDPFDCIALSLEGISQDTLQEFLRRRAVQEFTEIAMEERLEKIQQFQENPYEEFERLTQELADYLGILSLSAKRDNILMWSHYSNSHQGFCLEFDISKAPFVNAHHVTYQRDRCRYDISAVHSETNVRNLLLTKYEDWRYEEEWRIIAPKGGATYEFPPEALTGVIFGCRMSDGDKAKVRNWIRQSASQPQLYQAGLSSRQFGIHIESC
jgi:hypothetical protein